MSGAVWILGWLGVGYLALVGALFAGQRSLLYHGGGPAPDPAESVLDDVAVVHTRTGDGLTLAHWYRPGAADAPVILVLHGNAGDVARMAEKLAPLARAGFGLLFVEYRGFGGNPGRPTEAGLIADALSAHDWLTARGVPAERIVLYGESLGSGVAVALAARRTAGAVVLEAPFTSVAELAQHHYWYVPARLLVRDRFDSHRRIGELAAPVLVLHGGADRTIPPRFGRALFEAAPEPKRWAFFEEASHLDLWEYGADAATIRFLRAHLGG